eukprot:gene10655-1937_t
MSSHWPMDLVLVRHGESEGNLAEHRKDHGEEAAWGQLLADERHTSRFRLTQRGSRQVDPSVSHNSGAAQKAGQFIKRHISSTFDRYFCSEYVRAMETAGHLGLLNANWDLEFYLREREAGSPSDPADTKAQPAYRQLDAFYWHPEDGESVAIQSVQSFSRVDHVLTRLREECAGHTPSVPLYILGGLARVLIVCHGNVMNAFRIRMENIQQLNFHTMLAEHPMSNCHILHYTRRCPDTGSINSQFKWLRSMSPLGPPEQ